MLPPDIQASQAKMLFPSHKGYGIVPDADLTEGEKSRSTPAPWLSNIVHFRLVILTTTVTTVLLTLFVLNQCGKLQVRPPQSPQRLDMENRLHCGNSLAEALACGCIFDQLTLNWLPQPCVRTTEDDFKQFNGSWPYWSDHEGIDPINPDTELSLRVGDEGFWTTQREHTAHCAFLLIRVADAARQDGIFDSRT